ncbi:MAG: pullulanase-type alpha-1,6-glucosidase [Aquincola sp.]|nr:pullulanase-type alpha-1,6-glucosidase [Aquincola sp.]MDH5330843.1 pullulanase-type alpha-1,6-glucosidase [Aquincola sp.]
MVLAAAVNLPTDACDGPHETVLRAQAPLPVDLSGARAAWLDAVHLRWAGAPMDGRFRLVGSRDARLVLAEGEPVRGADIALTLDVVPPLPPASARQRFSHIGEGPTLAVREHDRSRLKALHQGQVMLLREDMRGRTLAATAVQVAGALDALYVAAGSVPDLGAAPTALGTRFKLWAPTAQRVAVCMYDRGDAKARLARAMQRDPRTGVWSQSLPTDLTGRYYAYLVDVYARGRGIVRNLVTDPYAVSLTVDSARGYIADLNAPALKPPGWDATPTPQRAAAPTDMVIYELHVRDFSINDLSVSAPHRGKYAAFTEPGSDGMKHLRMLSDAGVTDVHLLPIFDLASVPERGCITPQVPEAAPDSDAQQSTVMRGAATDCFNWGYDPWHFNAPEGSFATDAADGAVRVRELRAMVQALHRANLRVGMDMVYNHTAASGQHPKSVLDRIVPGYYHRLDADGGVERSTCCENTATENLMMAKLMIDSAVVWAYEYKIDSFRFDLMGHQPREAMERLQRAVNAATGRRIHLIGEGWNFGEVKDGARFVQAAQGRLDGSSIGTFSDRARDAARGSGFGGPEEVARARGWIHGAGSAAQADLVRVGLAGTLAGYETLNRGGVRQPLARIDYNGQPAGYASQPGEVVNYVENHDNQTLFDNNVIKLPIDTSREDRARVQVLGAAIVALSQGIAYFHAGQEILRSKSLDRNSYDSGDWFNRLDWTLQDNGFGAGLPPARDNKGHWALMQPLLAASAAIKPTPAEIAWTRDAFLDLLRIRASTPLLRLRSADEVQRRLKFEVNGMLQDPTLIAGELDGAGMPDAVFDRVLYFINAETVPQTMARSLDKQKAWMLHPVHRAPGAADRRAAGATYNPEDGTFTIPPRTAVVFVLER